MASDYADKCSNNFAVDCATTRVRAENNPSILSSVEELHYITLTTRLWRPKVHICKIATLLFIHLLVSLTELVQKLCSHYNNKSEAELITVNTWEGCVPLLLCCTKSFYIKRTQLNVRNFVR